MSSCTGAPPLTSELPEIARQIGTFPTQFRWRITHLVDECGARIAPVLLKWLSLGDLASRLDFVEAKYEFSELSHTDLTHNSGFVRQGAEDKFLASLGLAVPK